jgi:hypothetical protein
MVQVRSKDYVFPLEDYDDDHNVMDGTIVLDDAYPNINTFATNRVRIS